MPHEHTDAVTQGCALTKTKGSPVKYRMPSTGFLQKKKKNASCLRANVRHQRPPVAVKAQP